MRLINLLCFLLVSSNILCSLNERILVDCDSKTISLLQCYQNCRVIYNGTRNYFNQTTGMCDLVTICDSLIDVSNFPPLNNTQTGNNTTGNVTMPIKVECVNGFVPTNSTICICYRGWTDSNQYNATSGLNMIMACDKRIENFNNSTNSSSNNNGTNNSTSIEEEQKSGLPFVYMIIIIVSGVCSFCCLSSIIYCIWKRLKQPECPNEIEIKIPNDHNTYANLNRTPPRKNVTIKEGLYPRSHSHVILDIENPEDNRHVRQLTFHTPVKRKLNYKLGNSSYKVKSCNNICDYSPDNEMSIEEELDYQENIYAPHIKSVNRTKGYLNNSDIKLSNRYRQYSIEPRYETEVPNYRPVYRSRIFHQ